MTFLWRDFLNISIGSVISKAPRKGHLWFEQGDLFPSNLIVGGSVSFQIMH